MALFLPTCYLEHSVFRLLKSPRIPQTQPQREEMMKRLIPTFNRILVQRVIQPAKTESGILLPEKASKVIILAFIFFLSDLNLLI